MYRAGGSCSAIYMCITTSQVTVAPCIIGIAQGVPLFYKALSMTSYDAHNALFRVSETSQVLSPVLFRQSLQKCISLFNSLFTCNN